MRLSGYDLETMIPAPLSSAVIIPLFTSEDGVLLCYGTAAYTVLEADLTTYAPGCIYIKSLAAGTSILYNNIGTKAAPDFNTITIA